MWTEVYDRAANGRKVLRETYEWQKRSCFGIKRVYRDGKVVKVGQIVVLE